MAHDDSSHSTLFWSLWRPPLTGDWGLGGADGPDLTVEQLCACYSATLGFSLQISITS